MSRTLTALVLAGLAAASGATQAACPSPPSGFGASWWSAYKSWCRSCGGSICEYYNDCGGRCTLPRSSPAATGTSPAETLGAALGTAVGNALACSLFGQGCPGPSAEQSRQTLQQSQYVASDYAAKIAAAKAEEEQRLQHARQRVDGVLAGAGSGDLRMRDLNADSDLQVAAAPSAFGSRQMVPVAIFPRLAAPIDTAQLPPARRVRCAQGILRSAIDRSNEASAADRSFYSRQAANYLTASPAMLSCPPDAQLPELAAPASAPVKELLVQSKAYERIFEIYEKRVQVEREMGENRQAQKETAQRIEQAAAKIEQARGSAGTEEEKRSAMEAALRALQEAKQTLAEQERLLAEQQSAASALDSGMGHTQRLMEQATADPSKMDSILAELGHTPGR